jgi:hypothetical protein
MWKRDTFHNCATELRDISYGFRRAFASATATERTHGNRDLLHYSREGVALLRSIALAVRSEQDYRLLPESRLVVGALFQPAPRSFEDFEVSYRPPFGTHDEFRPLTLRAALNKIAHPDPRKAGYRASDEIHEIIVGGSQGSEEWIAVISLPQLCQVIMDLPDHRV